FRTGKVELKHDLYSGQTPRSRRSSPPDTVREPNHYWGQSLHSAGAPYSVKSVGRFERIPQVPSTLFYDGTTSWELFQTQFTSFLGKHDMLWDHVSEAFHCLRGALHGMAADYFAQMCQRNEITFTDIGTPLSVMRNRFSANCSPQAAHAQLNHAKQFEGEPIESWAGRVWKLACQAYPTFETQYIEREVAVASFSRGLQDERASQHLVEYNCTTVNQAIAEYMNFLSAKSATNGFSRDGGHNVNQNQSFIQQRASTPLPNRYTVNEPNCYWGQGPHSDGAPFLDKRVTEQGSPFCDDDDDVSQSECDIQEEIDNLHEQLSAQVKISVSLQSTVESQGNEIKSLKETVSSLESMVKELMSRIPCQSQSPQMSCENVVHNTHGKETDTGKDKETYVSENLNDQPVHENSDNANTLNC
ncbi:MAG: hypothetical protein GY694_00810, partial [Gammaproteobacteria bacterium]|nr:hypothetical protein [Gammaproteobacteria bacterium]